MHKYSLFLLFSVKGKCGLNFAEFVNLTSSEICPVGTILEKYNLTTLQYNGPTDDWDGDTSFGILTYSNLNHVDLDLYIHDVFFSSITFITVSHLPSTNNGVDAFVSPLDAKSWICLQLTIALVSGFLTWLECQDGNHESWMADAAIMVDKVIAVTCILLGQVGESMGRAYRTEKGSLVLLPLWLFGSFLLMANLYQGSIYSNLAVLIPTQPPSGIYDLVNGNIPIVPIDFAYDYRTNSHNTLLSDYIIPPLIEGGRENSELTKFLTEFQKRLVQVKDKIQFGVAKIYADYIVCNPMAVLFIHTPKVVPIERRIKQLPDNLHIVQNKGDSPFTIVPYMTGDENLLTPYFAKDWTRMYEAGLHQLWYKVYLQYLALANKGSLMRVNKYFEAVQRAFDNVKEPATFHESHSVSLGRIIPAFVLCSAVMAIGAIAFMAECRKHRIKKFLFLRILQGLTIICRVCKCNKDSVVTHSPKDLGRVRIVRSFRLGVG